MTRVDFYILQQGGRQAALNYACRLAEKAFLKGHRCYICVDEPDMTTVDELLWQFRADSFVPHALAGRDDGHIAIGTEHHTGEHCDVMINLTTAVPSTFSRFKRLAEIVSQDEPWLSASRGRYSHYRQAGYPLHNHPIAAG